MTGATTTEPQQTLSSWDELAPEAGGAAQPLIIDVDGFEGPLDLLLAMARTHKVDITKISLLALADQYLSFIAETRRLHLEVAAEYLVMAAWLAYLKSRLLLPRDGDNEAEPDGQELAARLAFRLQRLAAMREKAATLMTRRRLGRDVFPRGMPEGVRTIRQTQWTAQIYDLLKAYAEHRNRTVKRVHIVPARTVWSVKDARLRLETLVGASTEEWVQLDGYLRDYLPSRDALNTVLASGLGATLEMARDGLIEVRQERPFAPIYMRRKTAEAGWERIG